MAELWQAYGLWALYGLFFLAFAWIHGRMHGGWGRARADEDDVERGRQDGQQQAAPPGEAGTHAHAGHKTGGQGHHHGGGCC